MLSFDLSATQSCSHPKDWYHDTQSHSQFWSIKVDLTLLEAKDVVVFVVVDVVLILIVVVVLITLYLYGVNKCSCVAPEGCRLKGKYWILEAQLL